MVSSIVVRDVTKKATRKRKTFDKKDQPLKVVYILNPMRVQTSAAEFRALVQELTGRDAEFLDPTKSRSASVDAPATNLQKKHEGDDNDEELLLDLAAMEDLGDDFLRGSYESLEEIFTRDVMEKLLAA